MNKQILLTNIIAYIRSSILSIEGNVENIYINNLKPAEDAEICTLDWIGSRKLNGQYIAEKTAAKVIICNKTIEYSEIIKEKEKVLIKVDNPKLVIAEIANHFFLDKPSAGIDPSAIIHPDAIIASSVHIGSNCSIGRCVIDEETIIYPNVIIYDNVTIGKKCIIQGGTVIGADGLGCERKPDKTLVKFPHFGGVKIGNNVELGANCLIAKGALADTMIGDGSKINGLCFIAHNCSIGKNVWITGSTMLAGSVCVSDNVTIFSSVIVRELITIGKGATVGMGSVVTKNIPDDEIWFGNPAQKKE